MARRTIPRDPTGITAQVALANGEVVWDAKREVLRAGNGFVGGVDMAQRQHVPLSLSDRSFAPRGAVDFAAAASAMFAEGRRYAVPAGDYPMASAPVMPSRGFSWRKEADARFTGAGALTDPVNFPGFTYTADLRHIQMAELGASAAQPETTSHPVAFFHHHVSAPGSINPAVVFQQNKWNALSQTGVQGALFEAIDRAGNAPGRTDFVEGFRPHGIGMGASAYGGILVGQVGWGPDVPNGKYAVGAETESIRTLGPDAVLPMSWTSANNFDAMSLATVRYGVNVMAGFAVNPFNERRAQVGFGVFNSFAAQGVARRTVNYASFFSNENDVPYGLFLRNIGFAAISMDNNKPIVAASADGTTEHNLFYYNTANRLVLGESAAGIMLRSPALGFLGAAPIARPSITGSRGGNAAVADLLAKLAAFGLITNDTTA